jgi:hypothetical protein
MLIIKVAEYFCGGLTEAEKRQLFDEHVQWYAMYGMSMRPSLVHTTFSLADLRPARGRSRAA